MRLNRCTGLCNLYSPYGGRTRLSSLHDLSPSLADIAAFMHEVEVQQGFASRKNDGRGIERIRQFAFKLQNMLTAEAEAENVRNRCFMAWSVLTKHHRMSTSPHRRRHQPHRSIRRLNKRIKLRRGRATKDYKRRRISKLMPLGLSQTIIGMGRSIRQLYRQNNTYSVSTTSWYILTSK